MNASNEAADQVVKITLEGTEYLIRLAGSGVEHLGALLIAMAKEQHKTRGAERLNNLLRSGKPLKVYTFSANNMDKFKEVAKEYGILYTILKEKDKTGNVFDVLVRADDESKINRIVDRFNLTQINTASLKAEILKQKAEQERAGASERESRATATPVQEQKSDTEGQAPPVPVQTEEEYEVSTTNQLFSPAPERPQEARSYANPDPARTDTKSPTFNPSASETGKKPMMESDPLSEPTLSASSRGGSSVYHENGSDQRPSVRRRIEQLKQDRDAARRVTPTPEQVKAHAPKSNER